MGWKVDAFTDIAWNQIPQDHRDAMIELDNLTPADLFYGRGQAILDQRESIKLHTLTMRRKMHYDNQTIDTTRWTELSLKSRCHLSNLV